MAVVLNGRETSDTIMEELAAKVEELKGKGVTPTLGLVLTGTDKYSRRYVRMKAKRAETLGMEAIFHHLEETTTEEVEKLVEELCADPKVHGVLVQLPVAEGLDWSVVGEAFYGMPLSDREFNAEVFHSKAFQFVGDAEFHARDRVKLYAHNGLHCFIAVQGRLRGVERFSDMAGVPEVEGAARALLDEEIGAALWKECGPDLDRDYLTDYFERLPGRLLSPTLRDHVARGVRDLSLKFAPNERIIGGLEMLLRNSVKPDRFLDFIADGLKVVRMDEGEEAVAAALANVSEPDLRAEVERRLGA